MRRAYPIVLRVSRPAHRDFRRAVTRVPGMRAVLCTLPFAVAACVGPAPDASAERQAVRVTNNGQPFQMWEGAAARRAADAVCGGRGVRSSIYDRYDRATGEWVYPGGCA